MCGGFAAVAASVCLQRVCPDWSCQLVVVRGYVLYLLGAVRTSAVTTGTGRPSDFMNTHLELHINWGV